MSRALVTGGAGFIGCNLVGRLLSDGYEVVAIDNLSRLVSLPLPSDDPKQRRPDVSLAREFLGWSAQIPLDEGLAKTIAYFRERFDRR